MEITAVRQTGDTDPSLHGRKIFRLFLVSALLIFLGARLFHFGPEIDKPHDWRQYDTAHYIRDFHRNGIDLFYPSVCWMGGHKTLILEFPLPEAVAALTYGFTGEDHRAARAVFFFFFLLAAFYFRKIIRLLAGPEAADWSLLVYLALPLSIFYSRAIHIDFAAVAFAHGMFYHLLKGYKEGNWREITAGTIWASLALLTKAPYAFYFSIPLMAVIISEGRLRLFFRSIPLLLLPVILFLSWTWHSWKVNGMAPDWYFIPTYRKFDQNAAWYFGTWAQRLEVRHWLTLANRFLTEVSGRTGLLLMAAGIVLGFTNLSPIKGIQTRPFTKLLLLWLAGACAGLFIFFNLNVVHDYYQIPFLAPVAAFSGLALSRIAGLGKRAVFPAIALLGILAIENFRHAETEYYSVFRPAIEAGPLIRAHTPPESLVVVSFGGLDCRNPHLLYNADRSGWSVPEADLSPEILQQLTREGAGYLAQIRSGPPSGLFGMPADSLAMSEGRNLYLYKLQE
jgi:hypothetical protein